MTIKKYPVRHLHAGLDIFAASSSGRECMLTGTTGPLWMHTTVRVSIGNE